MEEQIKPMVINLSDWYKKISNETGRYYVMRGDEEVDCCIGSSQGVADLFGIDLDEVENVPNESNTLVIGNFCIIIEGPGADVKLDTVNTLLNFSFREWVTRVLTGKEKIPADFDFGTKRVTIQEVDNLGHMATYICNGKVEKAIKLLGGPDFLTSFPAVYYTFNELVTLTADDLKEEINISLYSPVECDKDSLYWL